MATMTREPVPAFSIGVKEQGFNELPFARMVVKKYGLESHERVVEANAVDLIPSMIYHMDEPSDPFGMGVYLVSKVASEVVKVVLGVMEATKILPDTTALPGTGQYRLLSCSEMVSKIADEENYGADPGIFFL
jgi:hypothetical protein